MVGLLIGDYSSYNFSITNFDTCVSKDWRPGFKGNRAVTFSWDLHSASGMFIACIVFVALCLGKWCVSTYVTGSENYCGKKFSMQSIEVKWVNNSVFQKKTFIS